jgi:hypothetical protein
MSKMLTQPRQARHIGQSKRTARTLLHSIILTVLAHMRARTFLAVVTIVTIVGTGTAWARPSMQGN